MKKTYKIALLLVLIISIGNLVIATMAPDTNTPNEIAPARGETGGVAPNSAVPNQNRVATDANLTEPRTNTNTNNTVTNDRVTNNATDDNFTDTTPDNNEVQTPVITQAEDAVKDLTDMDDADDTDDNLNTGVVVTVVAVTTVAIGLVTYYFIKNRD
ncbi:MAG: hypothetical protein PHR25_05080 [Clostridia bacterium]|nr:hypothetical protein [Clostridia bacterium]MDD4376138.1 hypothetical protein [Clostridia bacterium]